MKRRFGTIILCFLLSLFCIACGNTNLKEETNTNYTIVTEMSEVSSSEMNEEMIANNSSQQESGVALKTEEKGLDLYVGEYNAYDTNEPELEIKKMVMGHI